MSSRRCIPPCRCRKLGVARLAPVSSCAVKSGTDSSTWSRDRDRGSLGWRLGFVGTPARKRQDQLHGVKQSAPAETLELLTLFFGDQTHRVPHLEVIRDLR